MSKDFVLAAKRDKIDRVHSEGAYDIVPMQECKDASMKPLDLVWVDADKSVDPAHKNVRSRLCARDDKTKKQGNQRVSRASQLSSAMPLFEGAGLHQSSCR